MNKILRLSFIAVLAMVFNVSFADEATFTLNTEAGVKALGLEVPAPGSGTKVESMTSGGVTIAATTAKDKTDTRIFQGNTKKIDFRIYTDGTLTFTAGDKYITEITMTGKDVEKFTVDGGCANGVWKGSAKSVKYTAQKTVTIYTITVKYQSEAAATKKSAGLAFSETKATAVLGEKFTAPTLTKATNAAVKYTSTNTKVATIDEATGEITLVAAGNTTIKAETEENADYYAGLVSYSLAVTEPVKDIVTLPYVEEFATGIGSFVINDVKLGEGLTNVWRHDASYKYMKASAFVNQKNIPSESWLVSPTIDLKNETEAYLNFSHCISKYFGTVSEEATLWIQVVGGEWEQIEIKYPTIETNKNFSSWLDVQDIDLKKYVGKEIKVGFKYVSTDKNAGTWEIKNVKVVKATAAGVNAITLDKTNAPLYNLAGQRVSNNYKGVVVKNGKKYFNK